ncbi:MAG: sorbosone dehydrogenase family protein, partial [bacterium]
LTSVTSGAFYGWPYSYIGGHHESKMPRKAELEKASVVPDVLFPAHSTPIDVKFAFGGAVVALHGSQNRSRLNGYKVVFVPFNTSGHTAGPPLDLVWGWLPKGSNRQIYGRPAGVAVLHDGSVLVTDDWGGKIWRIKKV